MDQTKKGAQPGQSKAGCVAIGLDGTTIEANEMIECYHYCNSGFERIESPLMDYAIDDDLEDELDRAGFTEQLSLTGKFTNFPALTVYRNTGCHPDMPEFMVDVKGDSRRLAWYVAEDFHSLQAVLKLLAPLTRYKQRGRLRM